MTNEEREKVRQPRLDVSTHERDFRHSSSSRVFAVDVIVTRRGGEVNNERERE